MPFCNRSKPGEASSSADNGIKIFYRTYGHGKTKVLLIIGLAGTHDSWGPQIKALAGTDVPNEDDRHDVPDYENEDGIEVCAFDNRGMGRSSVPTKKSEYTTSIMAKDALALMDHLGWKKAHVFGHSMGAMIACKLAALAPNRISSLALLNVTGGGFECFPKIDRKMISIAIRFLRAKTPEQRAAVDLDTHYTKEYLDEYVGSTTRRKILYQPIVINVISKDSPVTTLSSLPKVALCYLKSDFYKFPTRISCNVPVNHQNVKRLMKKNKAIMKEAIDNLARSISN